MPMAEALPNYYLASTHRQFNLKAVRQQMEEQGMGMQ